MRIPFRKMHGAGNDFVVLDGRATPMGLTRERIAALADRHTGIGCDQLVLLGAADGAHARMRFFNADGGEAGACGNGTRCVAWLLMRELGVAAVALRTAAGLLTAKRAEDGLVCVDMGPVWLHWQDIPLACATDTLHLPIGENLAAASMGNPHVTMFTEDVDQVVEVGPLLAKHPLFPQSVNVGLVRVDGPERLRLRTWERGAGLTRACGSGACAAVVNASRRGLIGRAAKVEVDGGVLHIAWRDDNHVEMTGPAVLAYDGELDLDAYPV